MTVLILSSLCFQIQLLSSPPFLLQLPTTQWWISVLLFIYACSSRVPVPYCFHLQGPAVHLGGTSSKPHYSRDLKQDLLDVVFPGGSTMVQYVDDLLVPSTSAEACKIDFVLLQALADKDHKASFPRLQLCKDMYVTYLGNQFVTTWISSLDFTTCVHPRKHPFFTICSTQLTSVYLIQLSGEQERVERLNRSNTLDRVIKKTVRLLIPCVYPSATDSCPPINKLHSPGSLHIHISTIQQQKPELNQRLD